MNERQSTATRRAYLGGAAAAVGAASGCLGRLGRALERDEPSPVTVEVMTPPEEEELYSVRIANHIAANLEAAGMAVDVVPTRRQNLLRDVLINRDFDMYVGRHPGQSDPDFLYSLYHSRFAEEPGWQNPTSYTSTMADEMLEAQRRDPDDRGRLLADIQDLVIDEVPLLPIAFERLHTVASRARVAFDPPVPADHSIWPATLSPSRSGDQPAGEEETVVRLGTIDARQLENLNPLAVDFRDVHGLTELIYEPLARWNGFEHLPWLARSWEWLSPTGAAAPTIEVRLRDDLRWHDGEPITAGDVEFTLRMLRDTTLSDSDPYLPAPRFRGRGSLVDTVEAVDRDTVRLQFVETSRRIGVRVLTLPILPEHVWIERTGLTEIGGIEITDQTTDAVITDNILPVGSGPFECTDVQPEDHATFQRFEEHFLSGIEPNDPLERYRDMPGFDRFILELHPSLRNVLVSIREGDLDGSFTNLGAELVESENVSENDDLIHLETATTWMIHLGFNLRRLPFTMVGFRRAVAGLIDREYLLESVFHEGARPTVTPVADSKYVPRSMRWPNDDTFRFAGEPGTGEVDPEQARQLFRDAGFRYTEDGELLIQD